MTGSDDALKRYKRRMGWRMGLAFAAMMFSVDAIGRSGLVAGIPGLSWAVGSPFSEAWLLRSLAKHALGGVIFGVLMSRMVQPPAGSGGVASDAA